MCGICGAIGFSSREEGELAVRRMLAAIVHRGPDEEAFLDASPVVLGSRRLSIIDLAGGSQPIWNEAGTLAVVYNGEIYNFRELRQQLLGLGHSFRTNSDTEVIVHAYEQWGPDCTGRFNGIFAFALWDQNTRSLLLARDHLGVKPLYYVELGDRLLFASEIKALLADAECPREVDHRSLTELFALRYVPPPTPYFAK